MLRHAQDFYAAQLAASWARLPGGPRRLHRARPALVHGAIPVIAEGPFDAIAVTLADPGRHAGLAPRYRAMRSVASLIAGLLPAETALEPQVQMGDCRPDFVLRSSRGGPVPLHVPARCGSSRQPGGYSSRMERTAGPALGIGVGLMVAACGLRDADAHRSPATAEKGPMSWAVAVGIGLSAPWRSGRPIRLVV